MYYEVYIDVIFIVNLIMDFLLLLILKKILKCSASIGGIFLGSVAGAVGACIIIILPFQHRALSNILLNAAVGAFMVKIGLRMKGFTAILRGTLLLYVSGFLLGGIFNWLWVNTQLAAVFNEILLGKSKQALTIRAFLGLSAGSYLILTVGIKAVNHFKGTKAHLCKITISDHGVTKTVNGLIDTGNSLKDPLTGKAVSVIEKEAISDFLNHKGQGGLMKFHYIPYHAIGKENGIIPGITVEELTICFETQELKITQAVLGICNQKLSAKGIYQMILNPDLINK